MKAACLLYHDVVENADWESSGFIGPGTARYKLNRRDFESHLACIAAVRNTSACTVRELVYSTNDADALPFLLTLMMAEPVVPAA